jgi:integrase/recombinase XerD
VQGSLAGETVRRSLDLTSWEAASNLITEWNGRGEMTGASAPSVREAVTMYIADAGARHLKDATIKKLKFLLEKQLLLWCEDKGYRHLKQLGIPELMEFRGTWTDGPLAATKKLERLRSFFGFCHKAGWTKHNPVLGIKPPKVRPSPTLPFSEDEISAIVKATDRFPIKGIYGKGNRRRLRAFVLLLRWSGLRVRDAVCLRRDSLVGNKLFLRTSKTGTPVYLPLRPEVLQALQKVPVVSDEYFFWTGDSKPECAVGHFEYAMRKLFALADVKGHCHMFRDTFAVRLLTRGVPLEDVAVLLGHSDPKITWKHYAPWVQARQDALEAAVRKSW